jgi:hypothetical protein
VEEFVLIIKPKMEYKNKQIWSHYYYHINHGGSNVTNGGPGSKLKPIGLWFLRIMHWLSVDKTTIQRQAIYDKDYHSDRSNVDGMEDDDVSFSMDEDLVGMGWERAPTTTMKVFLSCASDELDGSESDSSENSDESNDDDDGGNDDEDLEASRNNSDRHIAKRQQT